MQVTKTLLKHLDTNPSDAFTAGEVAKRIGVARRSVWTALRKLQEQGLVRVVGCVPNSKHKPVRLWKYGVQEKTMPKTTIRESVLKFLEGKKKGYEVTAAGLSRDLGISRGPARYVLIQLETEGRVDELDAEPTGVGRPARTFLWLGAQAPGVTTETNGEAGLPAEVASSSVVEATAEEGGLPSLSALLQMVEKTIHGLRRQADHLVEKNVAVSERLAEQEKELRALEASNDFKDQKIVELSHGLHQLEEKLKSEVV